MTRVKHSNRNQAFSLIELVIVVVIIAIIGAIAIPRMSRGAAGAADAALTGDLAVLRNAVDLYATEHGGTFPAVGTIEAQLTQFTDNLGATSASPTATHIYGPYLRKLPPLPVGTLKGQTAVHGGTLGGAGFGWHYNDTTGEVKANLAGGEADVSGKDYNTY
ncbi:MAG: prepilin-type N-terminal cleavage/methylation domain-containing protein [Phycisphaerae bacterium]|nr:prepilin-type N-terminal cleavage/methylation domain-containing protein [Phycisphaerae bacterium]